MLMLSFGVFSQGHHKSHSNHTTMVHKVTFDKYSKEASHINLHF